LDYTQEINDSINTMTSSQPFHLSILSLSALGFVDAPSDDCYLCIDVDDTALTIKDWRLPNPHHNENHNHHHDSNSNNNNATSEDDEGDECLGFARGVEIPVLWQRLPRRTMKSLLPRDLFCTSTVNGPAGEVIPGPQSIVLEYRRSLRGEEKKINKLGGRDGLLEDGSLLASPAPSLGQRQPQVMGTPGADSVLTQPPTGDSPTCTDEHPPTPHPASKKSPFFLTDALEDSLDGDDEIGDVAAEDEEEDDDDEKTIEVETNNDSATSSKVGSESLMLTTQPMDGLSDDNDDSTIDGKPVDGEDESLSKKKSFEAPYATNHPSIRTTEPERNVETDDLGTSSDCHVESFLGGEEPVVKNLGQDLASAGDEYCEDAAHQGDQQDGLSDDQVCFMEVNGTKSAVSKKGEEEGMIAEEISDDETTLGEDVEDSKKIGNVDSVKTGDSAVSPAKEIMMFTSGSQGEKSNFKPSRHGLDRPEEITAHKSTELIKQKNECGTEVGKDEPSQILGEERASATGKEAGKQYSSQISARTLSPTLYGGTATPPMARMDRNDETQLSADLLSPMAETLDDDEDDTDVSTDSPGATKGTHLPSRESSSAKKPPASSEEDSRTMPTIEANGTNLPSQESSSAKKPHASITDSPSQPSIAAESTGDSVAAAEESTLPSHESSSAKQPPASDPTEEDLTTVPSQDSSSAKKPTASTTAEDNSPMVPAIPSESAEKPVSRKRTQDDGEESDSGGTPAPSSKRPKTKQASVGRSSGRKKNILAAEVAETPSTRKRSRQNTRTASSPGDKAAQIRVMTTGVTLSNSQKTVSSCEIPACVCVAQSY
jgi:hypothetical protein